MGLTQKNVNFRGVLYEVTVMNIFEGMGRDPVLDGVLNIKHLFIVIIQRM